MRSACEDASTRLIWRSTPAIVSAVSSASSAVRIAAARISSTQGASASPSSRCTARISGHCPTPTAAISFGRPSMKLIMRVIGAPARRATSSGIRMRPWIPVDIGWRITSVPSDSVSSKVLLAPRSMALKASRSCCSDTVAATTPAKRPSGPSMRRDSTSDSAPELRLSAGTLM